MKYAIDEAKKAYSIKETPIGAVVVFNGKVVGSGFNSVEVNSNSIKHAEIVAIEDASRNLGRWRLSDCEIYITMEPCVMCCGAIVNSRIKKVYIGARHNKNHIVDKHNLYKNDIYSDFGIKIKFGILEDRCSEILSRFFREKRKNII